MKLKKGQTLYHKGKRVTGEVPAETSEEFEKGRGEKPKPKPAKK